MKTGQNEGCLNPIESLVDLDAMRGWEEYRDPALQAPHRSPELAELVQLQHGDPVARYSIRGTDVLLGRFQSQYAPVDVHFHQLQDHQTYRLGAPHAHLRYEDEEGDWLLDVVSPRAHTFIAQRSLTHLQPAAVLSDGDLITLGVTKFRFRPHDISNSRRLKSQKAQLSGADGPTLFLKRSGGICGPHCQLDKDQPLVLGRSFPAPGQLPNTDHWPPRDLVWWDLSGLYDFERRFIAFRHAVITLYKDRWTVAPLSARQRTFVNRIAISGRVALQSGDEIGLGSVLFRFYDPDDADATEEERPQHVPAVVDWSEGHPPSNITPSDATPDESTTENE